MERAHFQNICPEQLMEWKYYDQYSRVFPALMISALCVSMRGDTRGVQDRVLALNEGNQDVHA